MLREAYAPLLDHAEWRAEATTWGVFDADAVERPTSVGACTFLTLLGTDIVGFASFDPRRAPGVGIVGHNCVRPPCQRRGIGRRQVLEVLRRLGCTGIHRAVVVTGESPFFEPARLMYRSCGFVETRRFGHEPDPQYRLVELARPLRPDGSAPLEKPP